MLFLNGFKKTTREAIYMCNRLTILLILASIGSPIAWAHDHNKGSAEISIENEGNQLFLNLASKMKHLIESNNGSQKQQNRLHQQTENKIKQFNHIATIMGTHCSLTNQAIHVPNNSTLELKARYTFTCKKINQISKINIHLFQTFNRFDTIKVSWKINDKEGEQELTKKAHLVQI
jgi:pterin-4a-carbinolamine dehydratase